eukprot:9809795-Ditylum_brightwellii.AAC.1
MMPLPFLLGFTPSCWENSLDVMLEEDSGSPKINHSHIIVIVEGDMNGIMKVIWSRHLVPVAGKTNFLSP